MGRKRRKVKFPSCSSGAEEDKKIFRNTSEKNLEDSVPCRARMSEERLLSETFTSTCSSTESYHGMHRIKSKRTKCFSRAARATRSALPHDSNDINCHIYISDSSSPIKSLIQCLPLKSEGESAADSNVLMEAEASVTAVNYSVTNTIPTHFEEFTPDITVDEDDETYRFQCSCPGLYQCSVTGLVFHMEAEGDVVYRTVPWNRRLLGQHHKKPAGPLFDIKCLQQSVCQLHLPHFEIRSTGGCQFLSVAHVKDEGIEFISPHEITETHVVINITGFSGFGNVKEEDSPPDPVRVLVLLFYTPPDDPKPESQINVFLLPKNVVLRDVQKTRMQSERYIETSPHCKLCPNQVYTLSTRLQDDLILVQPTEAEFDSDNYVNYFPTFQVDLERPMQHITLFLGDTNSPNSVWERLIGLLPSRLRSCTPNLPPNEKLLDIQSSFINSISGPVLNSLLDKLLVKKVITDSERESVDAERTREDKARLIINTVRKKGEAASSEMIKFLCELDPFLCKHLGLKN